LTFYCPAPARPAIAARAQQFPATCVGGAETGWTKTRQANTINPIGAARIGGAKVLAQGFSA